MKEPEYFARFQFTAPKPWHEGPVFQMIELPPDPNTIVLNLTDKQPAETKPTESTLLESSPEIPASPPNDKPLWDLPSLVTTFQEVCKEIKADNGDIFPNTWRISLVAQEDLRPKTEKGREWLMENYGEYIIGHSAAQHSRLGEGLSHIKLGYLGQENTAAPITVLNSLAHEVGHSLGETLPSSIDEEMKAYAFTQLFLRYVYNSDIVEDISGSLSPDKPHDVAQFRVIQLVIAGVPEEAILSHLTGRQYGEFTPNSWADIVQQESIRLGLKGLKNENYSV